MCWACGGSNNSDDFGEGCGVKIDGDDSWSVMDEDGNIIVRDYFSEAPSTVIEGMFNVKDDDGYYIYSIDNPKKALNKEPFTYISCYVDGQAWGSREGTPVLLVNRDGAVTKVLKDNIQSVQVLPWMPDRVIYTDSDGKCGLLGQNGEVVVNAKWKQLIFAGEGMFIAVDEDGDQSLIDKNGEATLKLKGNDRFMLSGYVYDHIYRDGWIAVYNENKKGKFVDKHGETALSLSHGLGAVMRLGDVMICTSNKDDNTTYELREAKEDGEALFKGMTDVLPLCDNMIVYMKNDKIGVINYKGEKVNFDEDLHGLAGCLRSSIIIQDKDENYYVIRTKDLKTMNKDDIKEFNLRRDIEIPSGKQVNKDIVDAMTKLISNNGVTVNNELLNESVNVKTALNAINTSESDAYYQGSGAGSSYDFVDSGTMYGGRVVFSDTPINWSYSYDAYSYMGSSSYVANPFSRLEAIVFNLYLDRPAATMRAISQALKGKGFSADGDDFSLSAGNNHVYLRQREGGFYLAYCFNSEAPSL
jgi:hypothetical protein